MAAGITKQAAIDLIGRLRCKILVRRNYHIQRPTQGQPFQGMIELRQMVHGPFQADPICHTPSAQQAEFTLADP